MTTLGIVAAVKAATKVESDHWVLWLAGENMDDRSLWRYTPHWACLPQQRPDQCDASDMRWWTLRPEFSPRKGYVK
jgi:hypothetical protein